MLSQSQQLIKASKRFLMGQAPKGSPIWSTSGRLGLKRTRLYKGRDSMKRREAIEKRKRKNILYLDKFETILEHHLLKFDWGALFFLICVFLSSRHETNLLRPILDSLVLYLRVHSLTNILFWACWAIVSC